MLTLVTSSGTVLTNPQKEVFLGRNPEKCGIVVDDKNASNMHLHFIFANGKWTVEDLCSTNGTWVNGERILPMQPTVLNTGDRICVALSSVFYFREKPTEDRYMEDVTYEKKVGELEFIIKAIKEQGGYAAESKYFGRLIDLLCETPLFVRAAVDNTKPQNERFRVVLFKPADDEVVPVFTRRQYADAFGKCGDVFKLDSQKLMLTLNQLGEHIVVNPNCENRLIIPKDIFKMIIFEEFAKRLNAKVSIDKYKEKNDIFAVLVCDYNIETQQIEKMRKITAILEYMEENAAWVPCNTDYSKEDFEKIRNLEAGDVFSIDNTKFKPDMLKHTSGKLFFPLFSQKEEAPADYANNFSWINVPIVQCCQLSKNNPDCNGIIVNAFTNSLPITNELIDIILNHHFGKVNLINVGQMANAVKDPNGGLQIELDHERLYYIRAFMENDRIKSYSIDKGAANDSRYTMEPYAAYKLSQQLEQKYRKGNFIDNLKQFFTVENDRGLVRLMENNNIPFQQSHFD